MGYMGQYVWPKEYDVLTVLVINRVSILTILVSNRVWFLHFSLKLRLHLFESTFHHQLIVMAWEKSVRERGP